DFGGRPDDADGLGISTIGEIEAAQAVIGRGQTEPSFGVARAQLDGMTEVFLGQSEIIGAILLLAEIQGVIRIAAEQSGFVDWRAKRRRLGGRVIIRRRGGKCLRAVGLALEGIGEFSGGAAACQPQGGYAKNKGSGNSNTHDKT